MLILRQYQQYMDLISGSSAIMRGQLAEGAQLSAEAVSSITNSASMRLGLKAKYLASAIKELWYQLCWMIRRVYDENITVQVAMPDGTTQSIDWESDRATFDGGDENEIVQLTSRESYIVDIKAGTGTPNAMAQQQGIADKLFDRKALTRLAYLDAYQYPNRQQIAKQLDEKEKTEVASQAMGRKLGMNIVKVEKQNEKADKTPGRREKT
jgi:hypothetical protein